MALFRAPNLLTAGLFCLTASTRAQTAAPAPPPQQLSPLAAYDQATKPIEIVHRSIANWSDSETASLAVAVKNGAEACAARTASDYAGDQLIAYARLCSLGVNWPAAGVAASLYISSADPAKPQLTLAYGIKLESALHLNDLPQIQSTVRAMLAGNPYDANVDYAFNEAIEYLQLAYTPVALKLLAVREPLVLAGLTGKSPLPRHMLYADGTAKAALEQYAGEAQAAAITIADLDQALEQAAATQPLPDEAVLIAEQRRRYALIGRPLPKLDLELSLADLKVPPPVDPLQGASTALMIFPPWCTQCVRMTAANLPELTATLGSNGVRVYALLAEPTPELATLTLPSAEPRRVAARPGTARPMPVKPAAPAALPQTPASLLLKTNTYLVPTATLTQLAAEDFPYLIVIDRGGIVRFAQVAPETALLPGDFATRAAEHVAEQWSLNGGR